MLFTTIRPLSKVLLITGMLVSSTDGAVINWVDFSNYPAGASQQSGLTSVDGLTLTATFSTMTMRDDTPAGPGTSWPTYVNDPLWPFDNTEVSGLWLIYREAPATTTLTLDFTSDGGLPIGGTLAIIDLELLNSSVAVTGYVNGSPVEVHWTPAFFQVIETPSPHNERAWLGHPNWDPGQATLSGNGAGYSTQDNLALLVTDMRLDTVVMDINLGLGDGVGFGVSRSGLVPPSSNLPEPTSLVLWSGLGIMGSIAARRRKRTA